MSDFDFGSIIIGYPGVGKTFASERSTDIIDFESSLYKDEDGNRPDNWAELYCRAAVNLMKQGFNVCVSSHVDVRVKLETTYAEYLDHMLLIFPDTLLHDFWEERLTHRLRNSQVHNDAEMVKKNQAALDHFKEHFYDDIADLKAYSSFNKLIIRSNNYNLIDIIQHFSAMTF